MDTDSHGIDGAAENLSHLRVGQALPQHQPERLEIIWSQLPHGFEEAIVIGVLRWRRARFWNAPDHQSVGQSPPANGGAAVLRDGLPSDSVEPQSFFRRIRNFVDTLPRGGEDISHDIAGFVGHANAPNGVVVDGGVVRLVHGSEPALSFDSAGTVTAHSSLHIGSPHHSHGRQGRKPFSFQQIAPGSAVSVPETWQRRPTPPGAEPGCRGPGSDRAADLEESARQVAIGPRLSHGPATAVRAGPRAQPLLAPWVRTKSLTV